MSDVVIRNPILNSPFEEPKRQFRIDEYADDPITGTAGGWVGIYAQPHPLSGKDCERIPVCFPIVELNEIKPRDKFRTGCLCPEAGDRFSNDPEVVDARPEMRPL